MDCYVLVLRLIHIVGGIAWVGSALTMNLFIGPTANATEVGPQFMRQLLLRTRFIRAISSASGFTVLAGILLYIHDMGAGPSWQSSGPGIGYGIGAAFAIIGMVAGTIFGMTSRALAVTGESIQGKPTDAQAATIAKLRSRLDFTGKLNVTSLLIAAALMAVARYLVF